MPPGIDSDQTRDLLSGNSLRDAAGGHEFWTTHWSVVLAAGETSSPRSMDALERLCRSYWYLAPYFGSVKDRPVCLDMVEVLPKQE